MSTYLPGNLVKKRLEFSYRYLPENLVTEIENPLKNIKSQQKYQF